MIVAWLTYTALVGALVSGAAVLAERAMRAQGWPARWVWGAALGLTAGLPVVSWLLPAGPAEAPLPALPGGYVMGSLPALSSGSGAPGGLGATELVLLVWAAATAAALVWLGAQSLRLRSRERGWPRRRVDGVEVRVSPATGPAAIGVVRGRVVVPEWALGLDDRRRRLLVLHEAEHVRAGDPRLVFGGLLLCALAPWHLPLWWQLARLRLAVEMDCDARVLRRVGDAHGYGALLVEVGQHRTRLALALAERSSMLERRIRRIAGGAAVRGPVRALALGAAASLLLVVACETPGPMETASPEPETPPPGSVRAPSLEDVLSEPTFTPMTDPPTLRNADEVRAALDRNYPPLLREAGIGGTVNVWFLIDAEGALRRVLVNRSSGREALDAAALATAREMRFSPGLLHGDPVPVWLALDIIFETDAEAGDAADAGAPSPPRAARTVAPDPPGEPPAPGAAPPAAAEAPPEPGEAPAEPTFTPMTRRPVLNNASAVREAMDALYPPLLRSAGIGGTTNVWFYIDENGAVLRRAVNQTSGHDALDQAALKVAERMTFEPARNGDRAVPVWVALDITFEP